MHGNTTHGYTRRYYEWHPLYAIWQSMKQRCFNPRAKNYRLYGGRGITMCDRWRASFQHFVDDIGPRPTPKHSIDRFPNKDGNYEPGNCRWATYQQQSDNRHAVFTHMTEREATASKQRMLEASRRANLQRKNPPKICRQCGAEYMRQGYRNPRKAPKFCSRRCYYASQSTRPRTSGQFA